MYAPPKTAVLVSDVLSLVPVAVGTLRRLLRLVPNSVKLFQYALAFRRLLFFGWLSLNLLSNGAQPKDVQELLGHADVSTTMNIYAHATKEAKRSSARLLDKVVGE